MTSRELRRHHIRGDDLRACMRLFPTGVALFTVGEGDDVMSMTVNSVVSVSLEPPLLLVSVHERARIMASVGPGTAFTVGFLGADQTALSRRFASRSRPVGAAAVSAMAGKAGINGVPAPAASPGVVECVLEQVIPVGDHVLLIGLIVHVVVRAEARPPQVFYRGDLVTVAESSHLEAGVER
ncbi:flavin reductase family protein [Nonomuraea typhae]|uniref:flavin reductase family protein n=1 Tax=Nonomuraea typhae TaxID=2603600 RepID=UPI0012F743BE|nr:flavin reductase family protein [Nonomuraea typhae]